MMGQKATLSADAGQAERVSQSPSHVRLGSLLRPPECGVRRAQCINYGRRGASTGCLRAWAMPPQGCDGAGISDHPVPHTNLYRNFSSGPLWEHKHHKPRPR